jgi:hypothetical protein
MLVKWFDKWFLKKSRQAWESMNEPVAEDYVSAKKRGTYVTSLPDGFDSRNSTRFTIHQANGGFVIQHLHNRIDQLSAGPELTVVGRDEDLGQAIAHIITLNALKN